MEGIQISVARAEANPDISVVKISGYIDTTTSGELERVIQNLLREQRYKIIIDLAGVDYISSAGWGIFISEIKNLRSHRGDLKLANMSENVSEVYELLEFSTILSSSPSVQAAVQLFESNPTGLSSDSGISAKKSQPSSPASPKPAVAPIAAPRTTAPAPAPVSAAKTAPIAPKPQTVPAAPETAEAVKTENPAKPAAVPRAEELPLLERIQTLVKLHPEWGAWKLKGELNRRRGSLPKITWGEVRAELKFNGLKSKAERFTFARSR